MKDSRRVRDLENGFRLDFGASRLPSYDAMKDANLKRFFSKAHVQSQLRANGVIDTKGRVVNMERNKSKVLIIEQEFKAAERAERLRKIEENEMRHRVQMQRLDLLEKARRAERLRRLKQDREIRVRILEASRFTEQNNNSSK